MGIDLFDLEPTDRPEAFRWVPAEAFLTPAGTVQGGAGLGAATTAMERSTGRPVVWATAQYLTYALGRDPIDLDVTVEVAGHHTTQARCIVSRDGREILTAHAALGRRDSAIDGVWSTFPDVPRPDGCERYGSIADHGGGLGHAIELRLARGRQLHQIQPGVPGDGWLAVWCRCWSGRRSVTVADVAFIGDFMPMAFAEAIGGPYAGNSLDNTIRIGQLVPSEWILLSIQAQQAVHGFGYGRASLWSDDGVLLGEVSQSVVLRSHERLSAPKG